MNLLKIKNYPCIGLFCMFFITINFGIAQQIKFAKMYPDIVHSEPLEIIELPDSSFMISVYRADTLGNSAYLMKVSKEGNLTWKKLISKCCAGYGMAIHNDSLFIAESYYYPGAPATQHYLSLFNFNGDSVLTKVNTIKTNYLLRLTKCSDGGYLTTSACDGTPNVHKFDSLLNMEWFNTVFCYLGIGSMQDFDGNFVTYGAGFFDPDSNYYITKLDTSGNVLWERELGNSPAWDQDLYSVEGGCMLPDSNYLFCTNGNDWQLMKVNRYNGDTMWTKKCSFLLDPNGINSPSSYSSMIQYSFDKYICYHDNYLSLINANGDSLRTVDLGLDFGLRSLRSTHDGGIALLGLMYDANWELQITLIKLDSLGNTIFTSQIELPQEDEVSVYPNPADEYVTFAWPSAMQSKQVTLTIYDAQGILLLQKDMKSQELLDIKLLANGIYNAVISNGDKQMHARFLVVR